MEPVPNCAWCDRGYQRKHHQRRYCSQRCKSAKANNLRIVRLENPGAAPAEIAHQLEVRRQAWREVEMYGATCVICGKRFDRRGFHHRRQTCSDECQRALVRQHSRNYYLNVTRHREGYRLKRRRSLKEKARATGVLDRECALCATVFTAADNTARIYCSRKCLRAATKSGARTKALPKTAACRECGKTFKPYRFTQYTCSAECSRERKAQLATCLGDSASLGHSEEYREFCRRLREEHARVLQERELKREEARERAKAEKEKARQEREYRRERKRKARQEQEYRRERKRKAREEARDTEQEELVNYSLMPLPLILRSARRTDTGARAYLRSPEGRQRLASAGVRVR